MATSDARENCPRSRCCCCCCCCRWRAHQVVTAKVLPVRPTCPEQSRVLTEEVLQWYRRFPVVLVECQGSPASVPASVVPGHILGSWGQLCCPSAGAAAAEAAESGARRIQRTGRTSRLTCAVPRASADAVLPTPPPPLQRHGSIDSRAATTDRPTDAHSVLTVGDRPRRCSTGHPTHSSSAHLLALARRP